MANQDMLKLDERIVARIDKSTKEAFMKRVESEGKNASEVILTWIRQYLENEQNQHVDINQVYLELNDLKAKMFHIESELLGKLPA